MSKLPVSDKTIQNDSAKQIIKLLVHRKNLLNNETYLLSNKIAENRKYSIPIPTHLINSLFANLQQQYDIDTVYHQLLKYSTVDSIRYKSKQALLESALNYNIDFQKNKFLRRTVNRGDLAYGIPTNTLLHTQQFLWSDKQNRQFIVNHEKDVSVKQTFSAFTLSRSVDKLHSYLYYTVYFFSKMLAQFAGQFHSPIDKKEIANLLRPHIQEFDIVLLKSGTHFTEKLIPGYFGHVGICLGNDLFIEAPRRGVRTCSTEEFSNGEIYLVIRPTNLSEMQKKKIRTSLRNQLGKEYDFIFNSQSPDRIICSDLVSLSYDFIEWQTKKRAGCYIFTPDDIVGSLLGRDDFLFEIYINQGLFTYKPDTAFLIELLQKK